MRCGELLPLLTNRSAQPPDPAITALRHVTGGRYSVMHRVGEGGMANVYYALHIPLDCPVVIKVMTVAMIVTRLVQWKAAMSLSHGVMATPMAKSSG